MSRVFYFLIITLAVLVLAYENTHEQNNIVSNEKDLGISYSLKKIEKIKDSSSKDKESGNDKNKPADLEKKEIAQKKPSIVAIYSASSGSRPEPLLETPLKIASSSSPKAQAVEKQPDILPKESFSSAQTYAKKKVPDVPSLPPLDEKSILSAVVKIQCPAAGGLGKYIGSGIAFAGGIVVTAAHVVKDSASQTCDVIFPENQRPIYYLHGDLEDLQGIRKRMDEGGIDIAVIKLPNFLEYQDAVSIFKNNYPFVPYPICSDPNLLGDKTLHFGYPSNYVDENYLSELTGQIFGFADIIGIEDKKSLDGQRTYKNPIFSYTNDTSLRHPYLLSHEPSFYGDSGGLAFDLTKQCIAGLHRAGTIGNGAGENYTIVMELGWEGARKILEQYIK